MATSINVIPPQGSTILRPPNRFRVIKLVLLFLIILLIPLAIIFFILYFTTTSIQQTGLLLTATNTANTANIPINSRGELTVPNNAQVIDIPSTVSRYDVPPKFVTIIRINTENISLVISPSPLYKKGALIRIENNSNFNVSVIPAGDPNVGLNVAFGNSRDVFPRTNAILIAVADNSFTLVKSDAIDRIDIRTRAVLNTVQTIFDPTGLIYRYFYANVYYVVRGGIILYKTPATIDSAGIFNYIKEDGTPSKAMPSNNTIGNSDQPKPFTALQFPFIDVIRTASWATPGDPINNFLNGIGKTVSEIQNSSTNTTSTPTIPSTPTPILSSTISVRNSVYLYLAIVDVVILAIVVGAYFFIRSKYVVKIQ